MYIYLPKVYRGLIFGPVWRSKRSVVTPFEGEPPDLYVAGASCCEEESRDVNWM